jgi:chemotaxis protein CheY-P-specific phosphatase CheC
MDLLASEQLAQEIATSILGVRDDLPVMTADALGELLNVSCGHVLTTLAGVQAVFSMGLPASRVAEPGRWAELLSEPDTVAFMVEEQPFLVRLELEKTTP